MLSFNLYVPYGKYMSCRVAPYTDSSVERDELISFLSQQFVEASDTGLWQKRLRHWWDENPHAKESLLRGWVLRNEETLVGFLGVIPTAYALNGQPVPSLIATSWVIVPEHRNAGLAMAMQLKRASQTHLLLDTTPSQEVQILSERMGWIGELTMQRALLPLGIAGRVADKFSGREWPALKEGRRFTSDVNEVRQLVRPWQESDRIEKWITPEYLRWYAAAPRRHHQFIGVVDGSGTLSSYVWLMPQKRYGLTMWMLLEAFSTEEGPEELHALAGAVVQRKVVLESHRAILLSLLSFPQDTRWVQLPGLKHDDISVCHFHIAPEPLREIPKHTVLAEGDYGL